MLNLRRRVTLEQRQRRRRLHERLVGAAIAAAVGLLVALAANALLA